MYKFIVLSSTDVDELARDVTVAMNDGWRLAGEMTILLTDTVPSTGMKCFQPLLLTSVDRPSSFSDDTTKINC